jgi:hypothetical protein
MKNFGQHLYMLKKTSYFIACHDAGAANIIMSQEYAEGFPAAFYCFQGPALKTWQSKVPAQKRCSDLNFAIERCSVLRSGTGWASDFEHSARKLALEANLYVIAVIDRWVNYEQRFIRNGERILPNEIEVMDEYAVTLATA